MARFDFGATDIPRIWPKKDQKYTFSQLKKRKNGLTFFLPGKKFQNKNRINLDYFARSQNPESKFFNG